jgi:equilibrative nucleoside transporter 1/2/3
MTISEYSRSRISQSSPSRRIFASITALILLVTFLCLSTFIRCTPSTFFAFTLVNAVSMAVAIGYLSTAVFAGAALLGTSFLRAVLLGEAAIGVAVSAVQVVSSMIALWGSSPKPDSIEVTGASGGDDQAEEIAARIFFGVSAVFLGVVLIAYTWLTRQPSYKSITGALEQHRRVGDPDERTRLVADDRRYPSTEPNSHVYQVFRQNLIFMFSLAYVFTVTIVSAPSHLISTVIALRLMRSLTRRSILRSQPAYDPRI